MVFPERSGGRHEGIQSVENVLYGYYQPIMGIPENICQPFLQFPVAVLQLQISSANKRKFPVAKTDQTMVCILQHRDRLTDRTDVNKRPIPADTFHIIIIIQVCDHLLSGLFDVRHVIFFLDIIR